MSFQDKIASLMARPGQDPVPKDDVPWWMKFAGRGLGTVGGFIAMFLGVWVAISIHATGILAGIWQILAGFIVVCCEAPCCCMFVDHVQRIADIIESRPYWNRAVAYVVLAFPPIVMAFGLGTFFGSGLLFATGVIYGMMALGKKASAEEMRQAASVETPVPNPSMRSNLVSNAQPMAFSGAPVFDSNV